MLAINKIIPGTCVLAAVLLERAAQVEIVEELARDRGWNVAVTAAATTAAARGFFGLAAFG